MKIYQDPIGIIIPLYIKNNRIHILLRQNNNKWYLHDWNKNYSFDNMEEKTFDYISEKAKQEAIKKLFSK